MIFLEPHRDKLDGQANNFVPLQTDIFSFLIVYLVREKENKFLLIIIPYKTDLLIN